MPAVAPPLPMRTLASSVFLLVSARAQAGRQRTWLTGHVAVDMDPVHNHVRRERRALVGRTWVAATHSQVKYYEEWLAKWPALIRAHMRECVAVKIPGDTFGVPDDAIGMEASRNWLRHGEEGLVPKARCVRVALHQ